VTPIDPGPTQWGFPDPDSVGAADLIAIGADLEPATVLQAYRHGLFPMPVADDRTGWWSPDPRGVLPLDRLVVSRSLRRSMRRFSFTVDTAFDDVITACADPTRDGCWIDDGIIDTYRRLHGLGWVHSIETRDASTGELVGGLYGVHVGGLFAGESMFHRVTDASKAALVVLVDLLRAIGVRLLDVQWRTEHLETLGVVEIRRSEYLERLEEALRSPSAPFPEPGPLPEWRGSDGSATMEP
jgi:leucyl/phenylalanyl-tRNA---protein transferase